MTGLKLLTNKKELTGRGFTIIELLVSITILVFIGSGSYAAYRDIARREVLDNVYQELKNNLSFVRQQALSGVRPAGCSGVLNGYRVDFTSSNYTVKAICSGGDINVKTYDLPTNVALHTYPTSILYKVIGDGVVAPSNQITVQTNQGGGIRTRTVVVDNQGLIQ